MLWLENMVLRSKLMLLTTILMIGIVVVGSISYSGMSQWSKDMNELDEHRMPVLVALLNLNRERMTVRAQTLEAWKYQNLPGKTDSYNKIIEHRKASWEKIDAAWKVIEAFEPSSDEGKKLKTELLPSYKAWREIYVDLDALLQRFSVPHEVSEHEELFTLYGSKVAQMVPISEKFGKLMDEMAANNQQNTIKMINEGMLTSERDNTMMLIVVLSVLLVGTTIGMLIIRSVTRSITQSVVSIREGAMQITSASNEVAASSSSLAQGASEQASSVEEVSATLEESTSINAQNTDNAREANILAKNANDSARSGYEKGERLSASMHAITDSAARISGIIKAIDQIAFQTNLLALNAAVEAARAGEHGLGFAVVADEVRNLAQRAATAAKETSVIIEEVLEQIKEGNEIAGSTHDAFKEILEHSKKVSDLISEISQAGKEQNEGMKQINQAMGQVDQVTQQVAANSEEAAAAAEELNAQAISMMETIKGLSRLVGMETHNTYTENSVIRRPINVSSRGAAISMKSTIKSSPKKLGSSTKDIFPLSEDDLKEF